ncbi:RDD family protein [bacterium SCSIO 12741]|nr:RDD family protein [bacterium SCSIO 12741]
MTDTEATLDDFLENKSFKPAPILYRIAAFTVDFLIFYAIGWIMGYFFGTRGESDLDYHLDGIAGLVWMAIGLFLWPISEAIWGKTIGKRVLKIEVISADNQAISFLQAFGRCIVGLADQIFLVGLVVAIMNPRNQRLGDLAAKTIVIRSPKN